MRFLSWCLSSELVRQEKNACDERPNPGYQKHYAERQMNPNTVGPSGEPHYGKENGCRNRKRQVNVEFGPRVGVREVVVEEIWVQDSREDFKSQKRCQGQDDRDCVDPTVNSWLLES